MSKKDNTPSIKNTLCGRESRYSVVVAVAKRAREIAAEAELSGKSLTKKPLTLAIKDFKRERFIIHEPEVKS